MLDADKINKLMDDKKLYDWKVLAIKARIPYTTLLHMLDGHDTYISNVIKIARVFEVPVDDIIKTNYSVITVNDNEFKELNTDDILNTVSVKNITLD